MAITQSELNDKYWEFENYMTYSRCDEVDATYDDGSILKDDMMKSVSLFIEFCCTGKVTDDDGCELGSHKYMCPDCSGLYLEHPVFVEYDGEWWTCPECGCSTKHPEQDGLIEKED